MRLEKKYLIITFLCLLICGNIHSQDSPAVDIGIFSALPRVDQSLPRPVSAKASIDTNNAVLQKMSPTHLGYTVINRKAITGAVTEVSFSDFNRGIIHDPVQLIQARVPGLNIVRPGGDPNEDFIMRIRGLATTQPGGQPLIVVDQFAGASMLTIDPADIDTFVVLRDAASAALYGTRGANGVILITTKKGYSRRPEVQYNTAVGIEDMARSMRVMSASEYRALPGKPDFGSETNWIDHITRNARSQVHNLSFSGGSETTSYRASINYRNLEGILRHSGFTRFNTRVGIRQSALKNRATLNLDLSRTNTRRQLGFPIAFRHAIAADPTMPVYDETSTSPTAGARYGGYAERDIFNFYNPVSIVDQNKNDRVDVVYTARIKGEYDFSDMVKGLTFSIAYAHQNESNVSGTFSPKTSKYGSYLTGMASKRQDGSSSGLFETLVHYKKSLEDFHLDVVGGYTLQKFFYDGFGMQGGNFLTDAFTYNNMGAALDFDNGLGDVFSYASSNKLEAVIGIATVNFRDTYFLTANVRHEGSSRFGDNYKRAIFPGVSTGVVLNNILDMSAFNLFKVRSGFGVSGNQPNRSYAALDKWGVVGVSYQNGEYKPSYGLLQSANPDLRWESKKEFNFGFDVALADSRLRISYDYFNSKVDDLIFNVTDYPHYVNKWSNIAKLKNQGFEVDVSFQPASSGRLSWATLLSVGHAKSTMVKLSNGSSQYGQNGVAILGNIEGAGCGCTGFIKVKEGEQLGGFLGYVQNGVNQEGRQVFDDLNGDGFVDGMDRKILGNALPDFTFGFSNSFLYKNFSLAFLLRGALGHHILNSNRLLFEGQGPILPYNIVKTRYYIPQLQGAQFSDHFLENASYVKLDNLTLAYNWPLKDGSSVRNLELYFMAQNLFTLSGYTGMDPEVRYYNSPFYSINYSGAPDENNPLISGMERTSTYPRTRTFSVGLAVKF